MSDILIGPQTGTGFVIKELWAVVVVHDDTDESVPAVRAPNGVFVPLIAADQTRLVWLKEQARHMANQTTKSFKLVRFDNRTDLETFGGSR